MIVEAGPHPPTRERGLLPSVLAWLSFAVPLGLTLWRASASPQWRDDMPLVRALGFVPLGGEGVLSSVMMQVLALLPFGGRVARASLVGAIGVALLAYMIFVVAQRVMDQNAWTPRLTAWLAFAAAMTGALSSSVQAEGTLASGAPLAAALVLLGLLLRPDPARHDARVWLGFGAFVALTAVESHAAGGALLLAWVVQVGVVGDAPPRRSVVLAVVGGALCAGMCLLPTLLRSLTDRAWVHLGLGLSAAGVVSSDGAAARPGALAVWLGEIGVVSLGVAAVGAVWGTFRARTRWMVAPLLAVLLADWAFPASRAGLLAADPLASVRLAALSVMAILAVVGVHSVALFVLRAQIPFGRAIATLLVAFQATLVLMTAEDSAYVANRRHQFGADVWSEEALGALPPRSLLLVQDEAVAWRLWVERTVRGARPDVVVVPVPLLDRGNVAGQLLTLEPQLTLLIRDMSLNGRPGEYALSSLADSRPLFVELDPEWDKRLVQHVVPEALWLGFAPHARGRSDRTAAFRGGMKSFQRVLSASQRDGFRDEATLEVLASRARSQAVALGLLGDREMVAHLVYDLRSIDREHPFVVELAKRMKSKSRGRIDVASLTR
ncbi:MAG: hypothetical protein R3B13_19085 [Polyangiaceae bacterium]